MNGAESLISTLIAGGVEACFTNPGTSEMHMVAALDRLTEMRCVLGLFEGVVTGAADGYARMAGKPACTLASSRARPRKWTRQPSQRKKSASAHCEHCGATRDLSFAARYSADFRHRGDCAALFEVGADSFGCIHDRRRCGGRHRCFTHGARSNRHTDRSLRCGLEPGRYRRQDSRLAETSRSRQRHCRACRG